MKKELIKISKYLSYILRHHPEKAGLQLDEKGFTDLTKVLKILNERFEYLNLGLLSEQTIQEIIKNSSKTRFEVVDCQIRALYGHSIDKKIQMNVTDEFPDHLYHGTTEKAWNRIKQQGLKKKARQYVHLSEDVSTAKNVGKRRTSAPVILKISVNPALESGVVFYRSGDIYLADEIPPQFLTRL